MPIVSVFEKVKFDMTCFLRIFAHNFSWNSMKHLYNLGILLYYLAIRVSAVTNPKARLWVRGRANLFNRLMAEFPKGKPVIWLHCASLGEFEQGRPVIEGLKDKYPGHAILLTFFSPSGYEVRKNYIGADYVCYLPLDTRDNAKKFIEIVNPVAVYFVKYEFWYHFINQLKKRGIPVYCISAIFRENQHFFKPWAKWFRSILESFTFIFVQNNQSLELLHTHGIINVSLAGDTRFDRVISIAAQAKDLPLVEEFTRDGLTLVGGSTWPADEVLLAGYINQAAGTIKLILAPHEIDEAHLRRVEQLLQVPYIRYSQRENSTYKDARVLIIDNIGMLSSIYRYAAIAYIGGGFGKGIHNILEAATFGIPILFGPNFSKFQEANDLISQGGAYAIKDTESLTNRLDELCKNSTRLYKAGQVAKEYVSRKAGATQIILNGTDR
jgi:3-deoxy-D-manno-octulosonic-acid transferase